MKLLIHYILNYEYDFRSLRPKFVRSNDIAKQTIKHHYKVAGLDLAPFMKCPLSEVNAGKVPTWAPF